ncbi:MAG: ABC transporter ATP-binding protein [Burkholderiaceae bacterium]|jgi:putative ABC transport system ATP-binding protein|nr:ABC transporter ATP-binding protein [Burkholderiaceae bacterium]
MPGESVRQSLIAMKNVRQSYRMGDGHLKVLDGISFKIAQGESCAIVGASGSGKSTLLNVLGLLDLPAAGQYLINGREMTHATSDERAGMRNRFIGFVFQSFNLLPRLTALENVALPLMYRGCTRAKAMPQARHQLERVGLGERITHRPADLSGGERQRVAIARALVGHPALILADEPTGNLDSSTAHEIMNLLLSLNREAGVTLVIVTHDNDLAQRLGRCLRVENGKIVEQRCPEAAGYG